MHPLDTSEWPASDIVEEYTQAAVNEPKPNLKKISELKVILHLCNNHPNLKGKLLKSYKQEFDEFATNYARGVEGYKGDEGKEILDKLLSLKELEQPSQIGDADKISFDWQYLQMCHALGSRDIDLVTSVVDELKNYTPKPDNKSPMMLDAAWFVFHYARKQECDEVENQQIFEKLLELDLDLNVYSSRSKDFSLHCAVQSKNGKILDPLLGCLGRQGHKVIWKALTKKNISGKTPLGMASKPLQTTVLYQFAKLMKVLSAKEHRLEYINKKIDKESNISDDGASGNLSLNISTAQGPVLTDEALVDYILIRIHSNKGVLYNYQSLLEDIEAIRNPKLKTKIRGLLQHYNYSETTTFFCFYKRSMSDTAQQISKEYAKLSSKGTSKTNFIHLLCYNQLPSKDNTELELTEEEKKEEAVLMT